MKYFWSSVKGTRDETRLPSLMFLSDEEASDGGSKSQLFAKLFSSIYLSPFTPLSRHFSALIDNFHITWTFLIEIFLRVFLRLCGKVPLCV